MFDYLVVGAGLYGATVARELTDAGKRVLMLLQTGTSDKGEVICLITSRV